MEARQAPRAEDTEHEYVSPEMVEMVLTMNHAHRMNAGDLVWFSWNAAPPRDPASTSKRKGVRNQHPGHGSQAICFAKRGALAVWKAMPKHPPQLFDLWLLAQLKDPNSDVYCSLYASFVVPPIGGYAEHFTLIMGGGGANRPACWHETWASEGSVGQKRLVWVRQLARFNMSGPVDAVCDLHLSVTDHAMHWVSRSPPRLHYTPHCDDYVCLVLKEMGWGDENSYWGPPYTDAELKSWRRWGHNWTPHEELQELRDRPNTFKKWDRSPSGYSPLTILGERLAVQPLYVKKESRRHE